MRMWQGVRTGLGHGGITCVLQTQFSSFVAEICEELFHSHLFRNILAYGYLVVRVLLQITCNEFLTNDFTWSSRALNVATLCITFLANSLSSKMTVRLHVSWIRVILGPNHLDHWTLDWSNLDFTGVILGPVTCWTKCIWVL